MAGTEVAEHPARTRLRTDLPFFARNCLTIIDKRQRRVPLILKPEQERFDAALEAQAAAGRPMRIIALKARQIGISTGTQAKLVQRVTQSDYHRALVLAHLRQTAGPLFDIGKTMYESIPGTDVGAPEDLRPKVAGRLKQKSLELANGSIYQADSAREFESGRGLTIHSLHGSEVAFWPDAQRKLTGLLQAVPDEPGTLVVLESTANGQDYFKELWDLAESGESDYYPFFSPWFREPAYRRAFANEVEREDFVGSLGEGDVGEDEDPLLELILAEGFSLDEAYEKLHWRRWKLRNDLGGDLDRFHQEFPSTALEAFITSGRTVFKVGLIRKAQQDAEKAPVEVTGTLDATAMTTRRARGATFVEVPTAVEFRPAAIHDDRRPGWRVWEPPQRKTEASPAGQYIIGVDASGNDEKEGELAYHVIQVINHRTRTQAAEYRSRIDADQLALEVYMACLYWNRPWAAVEVTGSWGGPAVRRLKHDYRYAFTYRRKPLDRAKPESDDDRLGWDTNWVTKAHLISTMEQMLREGSHGIRSKGLALELGWFIRDERNRAKPQRGKWSDRLMAYMIAQFVAGEKPLRSDRKPGDVSSTIDHLHLSKAGYL